MTIVGAYADGVRGFVWADTECIRRRARYVMGHVYKVEANRRAGIVVAGAGTRGGNWYAAKACQEAKSFDQFCSDMPLLFRNWYKMAESDAQWVFLAAGYSDRAKALIAVSIEAPHFKAVEVSPGFGCPPLDGPLAGSDDILRLARQQMNTLKREVPYVRGDVIVVAEVRRGSASVSAFELGTGARISKLSRIPSMGSLDEKLATEIRE